MSKTKKKTVVKVKIPRTRNLIAKALCSGRQFQSRPFVNRKKMPAKFDWRKEIGSAPRLRTELRIRPQQRL